MIFQKTQFDSQHPRGSPQPFVTPVPENLKHSSDDHGYQSYTRYVKIHANKTLIH